MRFLNRRDSQGKPWWASAEADRPDVTGEKVEHALQDRYGSIPASQVTHWDDQTDFARPCIFGFGFARNPGVGRVDQSRKHEQVERDLGGNHAELAQISERVADAVT